jgi:hypothetical protein
MSLEVAKSKERGPEIVEMLLLNDASIVFGLLTTMAEYEGWKNVAKRLETYLIGMEKAGT